MGFVPEGAKWFLAQILVLTEFEGREESELEISWRLVRADTVDEAYDNAIRHGRERELTFTNIYQEKVTRKFLGLQDLDVIHDPLEDGAELAFEVVENPSSSEVASHSKAKHELSLFTPTPTPDITPLLHQPASNVEVSPTQTGAERYWTTKNTLQQSPEARAPP